MGQLKQIYSALVVYSADYEGFNLVYGLGDIKPVCGAHCLEPYGLTERLRFCPDMPNGAKEGWYSSYAWRISACAPGPGRDMLTASIEALGNDAPLVVCTIHDEVYYLPRERGTAKASAGRFDIHLTLDGRAIKKRVQMPRTLYFTAASLEQVD